VVFQKILIAIDDEPIAAHAADIGAELARLLGAEMAFIRVIDAELVNAADTGIQPDVFVASAKTIFASASRSRWPLRHTPCPVLVVRAKD
jgi:nucleotide-binding universal stress UspA family protein